MFQCTLIKEIFSVYRISSFEVCVLKLTLSSITTFYTAVNVIFFSAHAKNKFDTHTCLTKKYYMLRESNEKIPTATFSLFCESCLQLLLYFFVGSLSAKSNAEKAISPLQNIKLLA